MLAKRATFLSLLVLVASIWSPLAQADRGRHGGWDRHGGSHDRHHWSHRSHNHNSGAALGAGLLLGASLLWLTQQPAPSPRVVVVPPPAPVVVTPPVERYSPAPAEVWYYCRSSGAYYPYVPTCATPWEIVPTQ